MASNSDHSFMLKETLDINSITGRIFTEEKVEEEKGEEVEEGEDVKKVKTGKV